MQARCDFAGRKPSKAACCFIDFPGRTHLFLPLFSLKVHATPAKDHIMPIASFTNNLKWHA
jgi:hypothetical protein